MITCDVVRRTVRRLDDVEHASSVEAAGRPGQPVLVSRHSAAYGYLPDSVGAFATPTQLMETLGASGFVDVAAVRMSFGIVFLYTARKSA